VLGKRARNRAKAQYLQVKIYNMESALMLSFRLSIFLLAFACSTTTSNEPWRIELVTSGGITGRGNGNVTIDSAGVVTLTTMSGSGCTFTLTADELRPVAAAVAKAGAWKESYVPENSCCDRIESALTLTRGDKTQKTTWITEPLPMPADLTALAERVAAVRSGHECT
jgi:hypothetical protein